MGIHCVYLISKGNQVNLLDKKKLWKDSLNGDGQQFHQYQQNEQSPLTSHHWT